MTTADDDAVHFDLDHLEFRDLLVETFPHPLQSVVLPVMALRDGIVHLRGTAFSLGRNLALTATHVVERDADVDEVALLHVQPGPEAGTVHATLLPVDTVTAHPGQTDIAVLSLQVSRDSCGKPFQLRPLRVGVAPPAVGQRVATFGYTHQEFMMSREEVLMLRPQLHVSDGSVVDYYPHGAALCSFPCFQVDGRADHQMSGGPVLAATSDGLMAVRGVVSTGMDVMAGDVPLSFASMTFPAMALDPPTNRGGSVEPTFLFDLALEGWIPVVDLDLIDFDRSDPRRPRIGLRSE